MFHLKYLYIDIPAHILFILHGITLAGLNVFTLWVSAENFDITEVNALCAVASIILVSNLSLYGHIRKMLNGDKVTRVSFQFTKDKLDGRGKY